MVENGKLDTQTSLLLDRTASWMLASWYKREALNHHMQDYNGGATKALAATEGV